MKESYGDITPIMALRGLSVFPGMIYSFDVGREKSIRALDVAMNGDQKIILVMQKDVVVDPVPMSCLRSVCLPISVRC